MTVIIGLTGSIGMGKTTASNMFHRLGLPICDSDLLVHGMLAKGGTAVLPVAAEFDGVVRDGAVDRAALGQKVFSDKVALKRLEQIIHPLVRLKQVEFIKMCRRQNRVAGILDVPLLYEVKTDQICDFTVVVSAPKFIQKQRVMARPGMTLNRFEETLDRQMPDIEKQKRADFVVPTGLNKRHTLNHLCKIIRTLQNPRNLK
ncbi:MAG: dephospho-CoA kinase [Rhodospirillaceae bacterium]|nr:dephospho-CoA kinase [Rhodospirillaceae bacterium]